MREQDAGAIAKNTLGLVVAIGERIPPGNELSA